MASKQALHGQETMLAESPAGFACALRTNLHVLAATANLQTTGCTHGLAAEGNMTQLVRWKATRKSHLQLWSPCCLKVHAQNHDFWHRAATRS